MRESYPPDAVASSPVPELPPPPPEKFQFSLKQLLGFMFASAVLASGARYVLQLFGKIPDTLIASYLNILLSNSRAVPGAACAADSPAVVRHQGASPRAGALVARAGEAEKSVGRQAFRKIQKRRRVSALQIDSGIMTPERSRYARTVGIACRTAARVTAL